MSKKNECYKLARKMCVTIHPDGFALAPIGYIFSTIGKHETTFYKFHADGKKYLDWSALLYVLAYGIEECHIPDCKDCKHPSVFIRLKNELVSKE
jgi:hypothetical protein